ncbi:hypothetical protein [Streptomyces sp. NPDC093514]|uniref:hypothetical protein n=1 Tax=Streptomyces sp. NPDC093514 TaxID=3366039 RepID=UPI0037F198F3
MASPCQPDDQPQGVKLGTKSGFIFPSPYWLIEEPPFDVRAIPHDDFFEELHSWTTDHGITVSAHRGGAIMFDFSGFSEAGWSEEDGLNHISSLIEATQARVKIINAFSLSLHSARATSENLATDVFHIGPRSLFHIYSGDVASGMGGDGLRYLPQPVAGGYIRDLYRHGVVRKSSLDLAVDTLNFIIGHECNNSLDLAGLLNDSLNSYRNHEFAPSLITAWTICETLLQRQWDSYIAARGVKGRSRRDKLTGRDFTASIVSEVLNLAEVIDADSLASLDRVRKARNAWMHSIKNPTHGDAAAAIELAGSMFSSALGREILAIPITAAAGV